MAIPISVIMSRIILIRLAINAEQDVGSAIDVFHDAFQHTFGGALVQPHIIQGFEPFKVLVDALFNNTYEVCMDLIENLEVFKRLKAAHFVISSFAAYTWTM